jgi:2-oxoglutarate ferredoxin oxidoreductase subunit alpha
MSDFSVLIGGKAGFGIDKASLIVANIFNRLGRRIYVYRDYPSLIRGGHTFSIIRTSEKRIYTHKDSVDLILALNQDTADLHKDRLPINGIIIYDSDSMKAETLPAGRQSVGIPVGGIVKEENAPEIMRNICIIGAMCKTIGVEWEALEGVIKKYFEKDAGLNLKIARRGYDSAGKEITRITGPGKEILPLFTGNEAISLGLVKAGLESYIAYPMTPASPILHFLAAIADEFSIKVIHPESEIAVMLMALGFAYCGRKVAVGTSGGGFCLMTEGLSFSGMAELPVVVILGQRPGPSTGLPTYSAQTELGFALSAGQGEFTRFVAAPGDTEECYYWAQVALNISWKYQIPSIILTDKDLGEGTYNFDQKLVKEVPEEKALRWDRQGVYNRYLNINKGISPLAFAPDKDAVIKVNSYEHDEYGITTEDPVKTVMMQDKRLRKEKYLAEDLDGYDTVKVYGNKNSETAIICWGSVKGAVIEAAETLNLKVVQIAVFSPFPMKKLKEALRGVEKIIAVENNATGQLVKLIDRYGTDVDHKILKYDGRPFSVDELEGKLREVAR